MILNTYSGSGRWVFVVETKTEQERRNHGMYMNMILIGTLKDNMNFDVLTRSRFQFTYFLPFLLDKAPERKNRSILMTVVETDREKDATTMAYMNMILIGTLKDNINCDILSRNHSLFNDFVLFQLHQALEWILKFRIFWLFWLMRANGNETEAKLLCRVQIGCRGYVSTVAAIFEAIFGP